LKEKSLIDRINNPNLTKEELYDFVDDFKKSFKENTLEEKGFPKDVYVI
jgi:hypothetical protein